MPLTKVRDKKEIEEIDLQLSAYKDKIGNSSSEIRQLIVKRDKLNEESKKLLHESYELKDERDQLNEKVKRLKLDREKARERSRVIIEKMREQNQRIKEAKKKKPKRNQASLQKELEEIEWKIQTTSMDLKEEKELVEKVQSLEKSLIVYRKIIDYEKKVVALQEELNLIKKDADASHQELTSLAERSQQIHTNMLAKINKAKKIKKEADTIHAAYITLRKTTEPLRNEIDKLTQRKQELQRIIREEEQKKKKEKENTLQEQLESQAREKLQRGEKLDWNEFQLLAEKGKGDETQD